METLEQAVNYGKRVAGKMARGDIDAQAAATTAAWRAYESYDGTLGVPLNRYVAVCVRRAVWDMWRRRAHRREQQKSETWFAEVFIHNGKPTAPYDGEDFEQRPKRLTDADTPLAISRVSWQVLVEYFLEGCCYDVVAKRLGYQDSFHCLRRIGKQLVADALEELNRRVQQ